MKKQRLDISQSRQRMDSGQAGEEVVIVEVETTPKAYISVCLILGTGALFGSGLPLEIQSYVKGLCLVNSDCVIIRSCLVVRLSKVSERAFWGGRGREQEHSDSQDPNLELSHHG